MKFICSKEKLVENINIVSKAVSNKSTSPILESIYLEANDGFFVLVANNLELGIESSPTDCIVFEEGNVCLDAKIFSEIIRLLPDDKVDISTNEDHVTVIKSGNSEFKILAQPGIEFPKLPDVKKDIKYEIPSIVLRDMIRQTIFSVSTDESKPIFTGLLLDIKDDILNIVAVDGFRVSLRQSVIDSKGVDGRFIVPSRTLSEISKILPSEDDDIINIYFTEQHILFEMESCIVVSRLIDGEFMNYNQIFPEDYSSEIVVDRVKLMNCLERSSIISKEVNKNPVYLKIESDMLVVTSNTEIGTTYEEIVIDMDGDTLERIAFNPRYLIDALKAINEDKILIQFTTFLSPCIIKAKEATDHKYLVLPLRLIS